MASRPSKWRILAVFGGLDLDAIEDNTEPSCGAMAEFTDLAGSSAEVCTYFPNVSVSCAISDYGAQMLYWLDRGNCCILSVSKRYSHQ